MAFIKNKLNIQEYHSFAKSKGGLFLSTELVYSHTKTLWQCEKGHQWLARFASIKKGTWCPICSGKLKLDINKLKEYAESKNGKLLSDVYKNSLTKLIWQCENKHNFESTWNNVQSGHWCPFCCTYKKEIECKIILEKLLNIKFEKTRFYIDQNNKLKYIEFDGYNKEQKIAFEYNGIQHYIFPNYFHKTEKEFIEQQKRDSLKKEYALENKITLYIIPYTAENELDKYINNLIKENK